MHSELNCVFIGNVLAETQQINTKWIFSASNSLLVYWFKKNVQNYILSVV